MRVDHRFSHLSLLATAIFTVSAQAQEAVQDGLWSDSSTWSGGDVPQAGDIVTIGQGLDVVLDVSPPDLNGVNVQGKLSFSNDSDLELTTEWITLTGELEIGTEGSPHTRNATITLTDNVKGEDIMAGMGDRGIMIQGGILNLHGERTHTWTKLAETAEAGSDQIEVLDASEWRVGDQIVLASTDFDPRQAETRTVTRITGNTVTLDEPLDYMHFGAITFGVERDGDNLVAEGSWSQGSDIEDGYPEFTYAMLKKLGWESELTADEVEKIKFVAGGDDDEADDEADEEELLERSLGWQKTLFEHGWAAVTWPREYGGRGQGPIEQIVWNQELARAGFGETMFVVGVGMAGPTIIAHGTEEQKRRWLPGAAAGEFLLSFGLTEPGAGSDAGGTRTTAVRDGDQWVLNGNKQWITNAHYAGAHLITRLHALHEIFPKVDEVFDPPISTFQATKKEANVPNVNTIPGDDVFYLDMRVLPGIDLADVDAEIRKICDGVEKEFDVRREAAVALSDE